MKIKSLQIPDVKVIIPEIFSDERGFFFESFNHQKFEALIQKKVAFVQDNQSHSKKNVIRGLHYQLKFPQAKLVRVLNGEIFDVAVDLRQDSPTFGKWVGEYLSASNKQQLWIPEGFAHGFLAISDSVDVLYKTTEYWVAHDEHCILWDDSNIQIQWPLKQFSEAILSKKDLIGVNFLQANTF
jgi:dTDP-4-dehydrorhamnose 3,5-epimerase